MAKQATFTLLTLRKKNETEEIHLIRSRKTPKDTCEVVVNSICKKATFSESKAIKPACINEDQARRKSAVLGRAVCGTCVSALYTTYDE